MTSSIAAPNYEPMLDEEFFKERAKLIRELADKADPVTKQRLVDLLTRYEPKKARVPSVNLETPEEG
jgi:hypothetical protein